MIDLQFAADGFVQIPLQDAPLILDIGIERVGGVLPVDRRGQRQLPVDAPGAEGAPLLIGTVLGRIFKIPHRGIPGDIPMKMHAEIPAQPGILIEHFLVLVGGKAVAFPLKAAQQTQPLGVLQHPHQRGAAGVPLPGKVGQIRLCVSQHGLGQFREQKALAVVLVLQQKQDPAQKTVVLHLGEFRDSEGFLRPGRFLHQADHLLGTDHFPAELLPQRPAQGRQFAAHPIKEFPVLLPTDPEPVQQRAKFIHGRAPPQIPDSRQAWSGLRRYSAAHRSVPASRSGDRPGQIRCGQIC